MCSGCGGPIVFITRAGHSGPDPETALSIFRHLRSSLAPYKWVRRRQFAEPPKTISGKIRRVDLRTAENARSSAGQRNPHEFWEEDFPELR